MFFDMNSFHLRRVNACLQRLCTRYAFFCLSVCSYVLFSILHVSSFVCLPVCSFVAYLFICLLVLLYLYFIYCLYTLSVCTFVFHLNVCLFALLFICMFVRSFVQWTRNSSLASQYSLFMKNKPSHSLSR